MPTWLLVGNASRARLYETQARPKTLKLLKEYVHPPSREKRGGLASDRPGHYQNEVKGNEGRNHNSYGNLMIVASPHFHGLLNQHMNENVSRMVSNHINKDYTALDEGKLIDKLR